MADANEFLWPVRVYYEDTDAGGVVYYANYLKFFERARSEWLNHIGIDQPKLLAENLVFVVKHADVHFVRPAKLNDQLEIVSKITKLQGATIVFEQQVTRFTENGQDKELLCEGTIKVACLAFDSFKPCRIPVAIKEELQRGS